MNTFLVEHFKTQCDDYCDYQLSKLLDRCYLSIEKQWCKLDLDDELVLTICDIYAPSLIVDRLNNYKPIIITISEALDIDLINIISTTPKILARFRAIAIITNDPEKWKTYLEIQYLL